MAPVPWSGYGGVLPCLVKQESHTRKCKHTKKEEYSGRESSSYMT